MALDSKPSRLRVVAALAFFILGILGYLYAIFYGELINRSAQAERKANLQALANPDAFTQEEKDQIAEELVPYRFRMARVSRNMAQDKQLWLATQLWTEDRIKYVSDVRQFGTLEYFSTAREVWDRKQEDCDGRAVLAAAVLKFLGEPEAKVATSTVHAEVSLTSEVLPEATPKPLETKAEFDKRKFFQQLPERIAGIPWGRAALGVVWYWLCGLCSHRILRKQVPTRVHVELLLLFIVNCLLEAYSQLYLFQANY